MTIHTSLSLVLTSNPPISRLVFAKKNEKLTYENISYDNTLRAKWGSKAIKAFADETGLGKDDDVATAISDLLVDLRHACDAYGISFAECDHRARNHYVAELAGD